MMKEFELFIIGRMVKCPLPVEYMNNHCWLLANGCMARQEDPRKLKD